MSVLKKADLFRRLTDIHERVVSHYLLGDDGVLIREMTAEQRMQAQEAANEDADNPNQALYVAMVLHFCLVDPDSGRLYADGRVGPDGQPVIDPRTRAPLFTADDIVDLMQGRTLLVEHLFSEATKLSAVGPTALFSGHRTDDHLQRDADAGAGGREEAALGASATGGGDDDRGALPVAAASDGGGSEPVGLSVTAVE